jgi:hypothetical protein
MKNPFASPVISATLLTLILCSNSRAAMSNPVTYPGNGGAGGTVANGNLVLQDNGSTVFGTFNKAPGMTFQLDLVIFIDSVAGGFADTTSFKDNSSPATIAISGFNTSANRGSTATFAAGFQADYAIILGVNPPNNGNDLYHLNAGGDGSFEKITSVNLNPNNNLNYPSYTFSFTWASIGIKPGDPHFFKFESTYIDCSGSRTLESFEPLTGTRNFGSVTFGAYDTYGVAPVPEMTTGALAIFGGLFVGQRLIRRARETKKRPRSLDGVR